MSVVAASNKTATRDNTMMNLVVKSNLYTWKIMRENLFCDPCRQWECSRGWESVFRCGAQFNP